MPGKIPFGLSTSWNGPRHQSLRDVFAESTALGFQRIELYAHFTPAQLVGLSGLAAEFGVEITSLHSPCPVPVNDAGQRIRLGDWLASTEPAERRQSVDAARHCIDTAAELGGRGIVIHLGNSGAKSYQAEAFEVLKEHGYGSQKHRAVVGEAWRERELSKGPHLEAAIQSIRELGEHARGTGVGLGLECRDGHIEIPSIDEFQTIFDACQDLPVFYWHDAGHGQKLENAGFIQHEELLRRYAGRLLGMHIHDTRLDRDHQAPGQAETDFAMLARYVGAETILTLELAPTVEEAHILPGVKVLQAAGFGPESEVSSPRSRKSGVTGPEKLDGAAQAIGQLNGGLPT